MSGLPPWGDPGLLLVQTWSDCIVMPSPILDDDLCLLQCVEDFSVQQFIPEL